MPWMYSVPQAIAAPTAKVSTDLVRHMVEGQEGQNGEGQEHEEMGHLVRGNTKQRFLHVGNLVGVHEAQESYSSQIDDEEYTGEYGLGAHYRACMSFSFL